MRTIFMAVAVAALFSGCANHPIRQNAQDNIHVGDSTERLRAVLGDPTEIGPSSMMVDAHNWYYVNDGDVCGFTIKDDLVKAQACFDNPDYTSPGKKIARAVGAVLKGAGDGLAHRQTATCTSYDYGSSVQTTCQ